MPEVLMCPLLALFGLTAAGWNGVFLSEVSLRVPPAEVGSATGAVMVVMTAGLVGGPLAFGAVASFAGFGPAYLMAAAVALFAVAITTTWSPLLLFATGFLLFDVLFSRFGLAQPR